eukprot:10883623-Lingulodinium_polyedra.AAC.1
MLQFAQYVTEAQGLGEELKKIKAFMGTRLVPAVDAFAKASGHINKFAPDERLANFLDFGRDQLIK